MVEVDDLVDKYGYSYNAYYEEVFLQYPIFLDKNKGYNKMKESSKKIYMYLKDRNKVSIKNRMIDEKGKIFLVFLIEDLAKKTNLTKKTIISALDELETYQLIVVRRNGFNKKKRKNNPNFYYLLKPDLTEEDVYGKNQRGQNIHSHLNSYFTDRENFAPTKESISRLEALTKSEGVKSTQDLDYIKPKDSKDYKETNKHFYKSLTARNEKLDGELIKTFIESECLETIWGEKIINCLNLVANDNFEVFEDWYKKIKYAVKSAEKEHGCSLKIMYEISDDPNFVEHVRESIAMTLRDCIRRCKTDHRIKNQASYAFTSLKNTCLYLISQQ